jgi:hypothetical protein
LIDNVQVLSNGVNLIANSTFETDASGWTAEGTESRSSLETTEGSGSSRSYHVRAVERGDNQVNRIRTPLTCRSLQRHDQRDHSRRRSLAERSS